MHWMMQSEENGYFRVFDCGNAVFCRRYTLEA